MEILQPHAKLDNFNDSSGYFYLQDEITYRVLEALLNGSVITNFVNGDKYSFTGELRNVWADREISIDIQGSCIIYSIVLGRIMDF